MSSSPCRKCGAETRYYPCAYCNWSPPPKNKDEQLEIARLRARVEGLRTALLAVQSTRRRSSAVAAHVTMRKIAFEALQNDDKAQRRTEQ